MKNIKTTLGSLLLFVSLSQMMQSCGLGCGCGPGPKVHVLLYYENAQGEDLLDPTVKGSFKEEDIKVYDLVNGKPAKRTEAEETLNPTWQIRKYFSSDSVQRFGVLFLRVNPWATERVKATCVQLSDHDTDTITHTLRDDTSHPTIDKVWYNGELSEHAPGENRNRFSIVKEPVLVK